MKRPASWITAGLLVQVALLAFAPVGLYGTFLSGSAWPMMFLPVIAWTVRVIVALATLALIIGLACLLRRAFRVWWIGAIAWSFVATMTGLWPLAALLPAARRLGNRPSARLSAWGGTSLLLSGALYGIGTVADIPALYWGVATFVFLGAGLLLAALCRLDGAIPPRRTSAWAFAAVVVIAVATQPKWYVPRMKRQADAALASLLKTLGFPQVRTETLFSGRPPVAKADDPVAALDAEALEVDDDSFHELQKAVNAVDRNRSRLHPLSPEEIEFIESWFSAHTNMTAAADAVSASPDYRSCIPGPAAFDMEDIHLLQDPRLKRAISYANLIVLRAQTAMAVGNGAAGESAAVSLENLAALYEHPPILFNHLVADAIVGMERFLLVPRIDLWGETDLLEMQHRVDNAITTADSRLARALAHEACFGSGMSRHAAAEMLGRTSILVRGSGALDFWVAAECRALFGYEANIWKMARSLFDSQQYEVLGDKLDRLDKYEWEHFRSLPPMARLTAPSLSSAIGSVRPRNCAAFVRTAIAVERYRRARGALPPSLEALVPEFLPAVPVDARSGAPIAYQPGPIEIPEETFPSLDDSGPATRILPAQTLPGFRLTLPDGTRKKNPRDIDHFFFIPEL